MHDCQVMLCVGMGFRAAQDLQANGIQAITVDASLTPDQAVADMVAGKHKPGLGGAADVADGRSSTSRAALPS
jgi:predicted Fe-Mo cluster-binding NifX family protein